MLVSTENSYRNKLTSAIEDRQAWKPVDSVTRAKLSIEGARIEAMLLFEIRNPDAPCKHGHVTVRVPLYGLNDGNIASGKAAGDLSDGLKANLHQA